MGIVQLCILNMFILLYEHIIIYYKEYCIEFIIFLNLQTKVVSQINYLYEQAKQKSNIFINSIKIVI